jgi:uncharacterized membrane protein YGL010W
LAHFAQVFLRVEPNANYYATILHIGGWIAQFLGHGLAEKRAPALLDSLLQGNSFAHQSICISFNFRPFSHLAALNNLSFCFFRILYLYSHTYFRMIDLVALLLAPMFVWMEVLFLFGYRPQLQQRLEKKAEQSIAEWKQKLAKKSK